MSIKSSWLTMLLRSSVSLLNFCLVVPVIIESGTLKSPTSIVELSFSTFSCQFCFMYFGDVFLDAY